MSSGFEHFSREVLSVVASIPAGKVITYGQIAWLVGRPRNSRMVGRVLHIAGSAAFPCHRVVNSCGRLALCWPEQRLLLEREGVVFKRNGCVDIKACGLEF